MALHRLASVTIGVPQVGETAAYYGEFGLTAGSDGWFSTRDGGPQLRIVPPPTRRRVGLHASVDDADDLGRSADRLTRMGIAVDRAPGSLSAVDGATGTRAFLEVA